MKPEDIEISRKLGIKPEMVRYMRPRLLSSVYAGDIKKLIGKIQLHLKFAQQQHAQLPTALENRIKNADKFPQHKETHLKKAAAIKYEFDQQELTIPMYEHMIKFLETAPKSDIDILLADYE